MLTKKSPKIHFCCNMLTTGFSKNAFGKLFSENGFWTFLFLSILEKFCRLLKCFHFQDYKNYSIYYKCIKNRYIYNDLFQSWENHVYKNKTSKNKID